MTKRAGSDKRNPETIDGQTGKPEGTPTDKPDRRIDLSSLRDVRLELAYLYREIDAERIESRDGSRRAFVLRQIHDCIVSAELERRIAELEERQSSPRTGLPYRPEARH